MSRIFIEGVDCSGKTSYINDYNNHPTHIRLRPQDYKRENKSWEMVWIELSKNKIFNSENVLIDRSFISIYVYSDIQINLFVKFVESNNLLRVDDEIKLLDIDYSTYLKHTFNKANENSKRLIKTPLDKFDYLTIDEFLYYKRKYWDILTHEYFVKNFCLGFYKIENVNNH